MSEIQFEDNNCEKKYFTTMPHIIRNLCLDAYEKIFYWEIRAICGESDNGTCFKSVSTLSKDLGIGESKIKEIKKTLSSPFKELGGKSLIKIIKRKKLDGSPDSDLIIIQDIWLENMQFQKQKQHNKNNYVGGSPGNGHEGRQETLGGSPGNRKEEPFKKNPIKEDCLLSDPVGPDVSRNFIKSNLSGEEILCSIDEVCRHAVLSKKDWKTTEIVSAWNILEKYKGGVRCYLHFIEGTIKNLRKEQKSKFLNKKEKSCSLQKMNMNYEKEKSTPTNLKSMAQIMQEHGYHSSSSLQR